MEVTQHRKSLDLAQLRETNERVADFARSHDDEDTEYGFLCECGDPSCTEAVRLTVGAYTEWADQGLVVTDGHTAPSIND
jgi:hypothetical protein